MCGFLVFPESQSIEPALPLRLRGPDETGAVSHGGFILQSHRLSIVGQHYGVQPLRAHGFSMVFNGEIYNFKNLANEFRLSPKAFESDAQCLFELLIKLSPSSAISNLIGHYAFALFEEESQTLMFARDHMGVKPLYFRRLNAGIALSSDVQTLVEAAPASIDRESALEALIFGGHTGERTLYSEVFSALPGVLYKSNLRGTSLVKCPVSVRNPPYSSETIDLGVVISESVKEQSLVTGPAACLVSSGIDSRIVKALVPSSQEMRFLTAASSTLELNVEDVNEDFDTLKIDLNSDMGQPHFGMWLRAYGTIPAHNNYFALCLLYNVISQRVDLNDPARLKVALTGEGADEYFGGYGRYRALSAWLLGQAVPWIEALKSVSETWMYLMNSRLHHSSILWLAKQGVNLKSVTESHVLGTSCDPDAQVTVRTLSEYDVYTNLRYGLQKQDIAGMLSSIEVRVPMVTQRLHSIAATGALASSSPDRSKLRLQSVAASLGISQPKKIGFPVSLRKFIPPEYQPSAFLRRTLPFAGANVIPEDIYHGLYMLDVLNAAGLEHQ